MKHSHIIILARLIMLFSLLLFAASLTQNCVTEDTIEDEKWQGLLLLLTGWIGLFVGFPTWLANPAIVLSWTMFLFRKTRLLSAIFAIIAFGFALSFLLYTDMHVVVSMGAPKKITGYGPGYWLWVASIGTMVIGTTAIWYFDKSTKQREKLLLAFRWIS